MSRAPVVVRDAVAADAALLAGMWGAELRGTDPEQHRADMAEVLDRVSGLDSERVLVAEYADEPAGAILVRIDTVSPLNLEPMVQAFAPFVLPDFRRRGVALALMEAATCIAEEEGAGFIGSASVVASRDAGRFMARLGLASFATLRVSGTFALRQKLASRAPRARGAGGRPLGQVLAARRSLRRQQG